MKHPYYNIHADRLIFGGIALYLTVMAAAVIWGCILWGLWSLSVPLSIGIAYLLGILLERVL